MPSVRSINSMQAVPSPSDLELALDDALETYLTALSSYQLAQSQLAQHLKSAYFSLAQSKLALGPSRLSQSGYDLSRQEPNVLVRITQQSQSHEKQPNGDDDDDGCCVFRLNKNELDDDEQQEQGLEGLEATSSVRKRHTSAVPVPERTTAMGPRSAEPVSTRRSLVRPPHLQFSSLPPPSLRSASGSFSAGVEAALRVIEARKEVEKAERKVGRARKRVNKANKNKAIGTGLHMDV